MLQAPSASISCVASIGLPSAESDTTVDVIDRTFCASEKAEQWNDETAGAHGGDQVDESVGLVSNASLERRHLNTW